MANLIDRLFGTFPAAEAQGIRGYIDVGATAIFIRQPAQVARSNSTLKSDDSLLRFDRKFAPKKDRKCLARSEAPGEELVRQIDLNCTLSCGMLHLEYRFDQEPFCVAVIADHP